MKATWHILYWAPRIVCILAILFISMFALDAFDSRLTILQQLGTFLLHLIPSFIFLALLVVAWRWERVGGLIFLLLGLAFCIPVYLHNHWVNHFSVGMSLLSVLLVCVPFVLVGVLFLVSHRRFGRQQ